MVFNRKLAGSMTIIDPENPDIVDPITGLITIEDRLYVFKKNGIYEIVTAEQLDPDNAKLDTRPTYKKLYSCGSSSSVVSRMILQFDPIINLVKEIVEEDIDFEALKLLTWKANKYLLEWKLHTIAFILKQWI